MYVVVGREEGIPGAESGQFGHYGWGRVMLRSLSTDSLGVTPVAEELLRDRPPMEAPPEARPT
jgi:hypothetical protein